MFMFNLPLPPDFVAAAPSIDLGVDGVDLGQVLDRLVAMGADLASMVHTEARDGILPVSEATVAFDRIARCVRRSVALRRRMDEPAVPEQARSGTRAATRARIIRVVEDSIQQDCDEDEAEALAGELRERMDAPELEDEIGDRPVAEIIADICHDLGLRAEPGTQPWKRRTPGAVITLWAQARSVPSPSAQTPSERGGGLVHHPGRFREQ